LDIRCNFRKNVCIGQAMGKIAIVEPDQSCLRIRPPQLLEDTRSDVSGVPGNQYSPHCGDHALASRDGSRPPRSRASPNRSPGLGIDGHLGDGHDELAAPRAYPRHLRHDLLLEIPRKDQDIVWLRFADPIWMQDGNMSSRQELPLLVDV